MRPALTLGAIGLAALAIASTLARAEEVTTSTLLDEMLDLDRLGRLPSPAYRTRQFSSHDRRANLPGGETWFSNADGFGGEPVPGVLRTLRPADASGVGTYVLAETDRPGAVVRCWTASRDRTWVGMTGQIRMYLDGSAKPVFDGPARDFLLGLYAAIARQHGLRPEGLSAGFEQRDACYCPIPFAGSCRIEWTGKLRDVHFYHIELREYLDGADVQTFRPEELDALRERITAVGAILAEPAKRPSPPGEAKPLAAKLEPGRPVQLLLIDGQPGKIAQLTLRLKAADLDRALRQTVLEIYFDRLSRPQVESPLGDFFGAAPGINPYASVPMEVRPDGTMICRFEMPFARKADVWVTNRSPEPVELEGEAVVAPAEWDVGRSLHFHAQWRVNHEMQVPGRRGFDLPFVLARGEGRLVGCSVHLMNPDDVPTGNWWGEGDEKIFVDDDREPSFFGTGSEDYFNYSWSLPDLFSHAYFAQPRCDGPDTRGFIVNNRWHILDDVPFARRLDFFMEMIHHSVVDGFSYARITYYYARPGVVSDQIPLFREDLREPKSPEGWIPRQAGRQREAAYYQMEERPGVERLVEAGGRWACGRRIVWRPGKEGEELPLRFDVPKTGKYRVRLVMSCSPDSGRCEVLLGGKPPGKEPVILDLYTPFHTMARVFDVPGVIELPQGEATLTLVARGKNPDAQGDLIGGDFLWIQP